MGTFPSFLGLAMLETFTSGRYSWMGLPGVSSSQWDVD